MASEPQSPPRAAPGVCRFGGFGLDLARGVLRRPDGGEAALRPKTAEVLRLLAENAGRAVSREELMGTVWPDVFVTDDSITQCVGEVRRALGDEGVGLLRTLPKRGYLLEAEAPADAGGIAPGTAPASPSLAVLPFANLGGDPEQDHFADGITEELIASLSRARWFSVAARGSAFAYKGRAVDVRRVGRELGVRYVLEGSVRRGGDRVRIACRLAETEAGRQVWAERLDGDLAGLFELQDRVAQAVAFAIEPSLQRAEIERARTKPTESLDAYDLYLRAKLHFYAVTREGCDEALALLRRAIALDPGFAAAKAFAASCLTRRVVQGWAGQGDREEGARFAREAWAADTKDPMTLICVADALGVLALDAGGAHAAAELAVALNPNSVQVRNMVGWTSLWVGAPETAVEHFRHATRLGLHDPSAAYPLAGLAMAHLMAGRPQEALAHAEAALRKVPALVPAHQVAIAALAASGRPEGAAAAAGRFLAATPAVAHPIPARFYRDLYRDETFVETFVHTLREAGLPE